MYIKKIKIVLKLEILLDIKYNENKSNYLNLIYV